MWQLLHVGNRGKYWLPLALDEVVQTCMLNCIFVFIFVQGSSQWEMLLLIVFCLTFFITCVWRVPCSLMNLLLCFLLYILFFHALVVIRTSKPLCARNSFIRFEFQHWNWWLVIVSILAHVGWFCFQGMELWNSLPFIDVGTRKGDEVT